MENQENKLSIPAAIVLTGLLIAIGIIIVNTKPKTEVSQSNQPKISEIAIKPVNPKDHILGSPNAPVIIVEYSDLECPFCKAFHQTMLSLMNVHSIDGQVAWVYRHFPIDSLHPKARKEAQATECANELGGNTAFWKYTNEVFSTTTSNNTLDLAKLPIIAKDIGLDVAKFSSCLDSEKYASFIQKAVDDAMATGAQGTPYSVMVLKNSLSASEENNLDDYLINNGLTSYVSISSNKSEISLNGALPLEIVQKIIDIALK